MNCRICDRRWLAAVADGGDGVTDAVEQLAEDLAVESRLAAEVVIEHGLVHAGAGGDAVDLGAVESARGKFRRRRREQALARPGGR